MEKEVPLFSFLFEVPAYFASGRLLGRLFCWFFLCFFGEFDYVVIGFRKELLQCFLFLSFFLLCVECRVLMTVDDFSGLSGVWVYSFSLCSGERTGDDDYSGMGYGFYIII